jgi:hypothetical protein
MGNKEFRVLIPDNIELPKFDTTIQFRDYVGCTIFKTKEGTLFITLTELIFQSQKFGSDPIMMKYDKLIEISGNHDDFRCKVIDENGRILALNGLNTIRFHRSMIKVIKYLELQ